MTCKIEILLGNQVEILSKVLHHFRYSQSHSHSMIPIDYHRTALAHNRLGFGPAYGFSSSGLARIRIDRPEQEGTALNPLGSAKGVAITILHMQTIMGLMMPLLVQREVRKYFPGENSYRPPSCQVLMLDQRTWLDLEATYFSRVDDQSSVLNY